MSDAPPGADVRGGAALYAVRRAREGIASLAALALVTAIAAASLSIVGALAARAFDRGVDGMLGLADPRDGMVVVELPLGADPAAEADAMAAALEDALAGMPADIRRTSVATGSAQVGGSEHPLALLADATLADRAELVSGAWPAGAGEVAVAEAAADRLDLATGDLLTIDDSEVRVAGVWRAADPTDLAWSGDPSVASGEVDGAIGPVVVSADSVLADAPRLRARWTVTPRELTAGTAAELIGALDRIGDAASGPAGTSSAGPANVEDGLKGTLARILSAVSGARSALAVPIVALGVIAAVIVGVIVFALGRAREQQVALVIARGATRPRVWAGILGEVAVAASAGALVGAVVAMTVAPPSTALWPAAACAIGATAVGALLAASTVVRASGSRGGRARPVTVALLLVLLGLAVVAGLAVAQAYARGGIVDAGGGIDPLALAAPWLVLLTLCLLATQLAGPAATAAERATRRGRGLATRLGVLQLARRPQSMLAGVLCLALAGGVLALSATLAVGAGGREAAAAAAVGADVRADLDGSRTVDENNPAPVIAELRTAEGIGDAEPAVRTSAGLGDATVRLLAATPDAFADMRADEEVAAALAALPAGEPPVLTGDVTAEVTGFFTQGPNPPERQAEVTVGAWVLDEAGAPAWIEFGTAPADGQPHALTTELGDPVRLLAVDVEGRALEGGSVSVRLELSDAGGAVELAAPGAPVTGTRALRLPAGGERPAEIPAVVTSALAGLADAPAGSILHLDVDGTTRSLAVRVAAVADFVPGIGSAPGVALDLASMTASLVDARDAVLSPMTVLVTADDASTATESVRAWATHPVRVKVAQDAAAAPVTRPALALFTAVALAGAVLGALGFAVVMAATARDRRAEAVPLRSFGFDFHAQRRARIAETATAAGFALAAGALAGWATALVVGPVLLMPLTGMAS
ncbi:hypothetical protein ABZ477_09620 [Microbacterium sp. NPDC019599]|uniref:hypothetical protein n=1 Tax=Microbacterium sp. NPDC019599 TaxID=3154690 RepID=UPI0033FC014D